MEMLLRKDRLVVSVLLIGVALLAWWYTVAGVGMGMSAVEMTVSPWEALSPESKPMGMGTEGGMSGMEMSSMAPAASGAMSWSYPVALILMWWLMMVAMMLPAAAPTILLAAAINRRSASATPPYGSTAAFTAGYLTAWLGFSVLAAAAQLYLDQVDLLSGMMASSSRSLAGGLLLAAGLWQFTPLKQACLRHCRSPVYYLTRHRRPGNAGAWRMGLGHGFYCLGCCWVLMVLLFVGGVMNLYWIAGLALYALAEKHLARGPLFSQVSGVILAVAGTWLLVT